MDKSANSATTSVTMMKKIHRIACVMVLIYYMMEVWKNLMHSLGKTISFPCPGLHLTGIIGTIITGKLNGVRCIGNDSIDTIKCLSWIRRQINHDIRNHSDIVTTAPTLQWSIFKAAGLKPNLVSTI